MTIKLNDKVSIDLEKLINSRALIQANSGGGKSHTVRRILEQSHGKVQQIVIDPEGEFATLREKYEYVLIGKEGQASADPRTAALLAHKLLKLNVSAIIDLFELHPQDRKRFVRIFLEAMVNAPKELWHPCLVVIDEAHTFVPEHGQSEAADAVIGLCALGRKRGFCAILSTQRISKLHKDAAAECNNKLIGRTGLDIDRKRAGEELGFTGKEEFLSLRTLKPGEFYAFGPAISDEVKKVLVGPVATSHPQIGGRGPAKVAPLTPAIQKVIAELADLPQEAKKEAATSAELKAELLQLRRDLLTAQKAATPRGPATKIERIEVPAIGKRSLDGFKKSEAAMRKFALSMRKHHAKIGEYVEVFQKGLDRLLVELAKVSAAPAQPTRVPSAAPAPTPRAMPAANPPIDDSGEITTPEQRVLNAVAWMENVGVDDPAKEIVAFLSGYAHINSKGFTNPCGSLRAKGLVDYPAPGKIALTGEGKQRAQYPDRPGTTEDLQRMVLERLDTPKQRLLKPLLDAYPEPMSAEDLCRAAGYMHPNSKGFTNPRGTLRSFGLIGYPAPGMIVALPILFL